MGRVRIGEHLCINLSRRSLCDNCTAELCVYNDGRRVMECERFTPVLMAFKRCACCGELFEVSSNFRALDYERCPRCNQHDVACIHS